MKSWPLRLAIGFCVLAACVAARAADQVSPKSAPKSTAAQVQAPERIIKIFLLQNRPAENALPIIRNLVRTKEGENSERARFAVDEARNSLIASGDLETLQTVEALIVQLDKKAQPRSLEPIWVEYKLHYVAPNEVVRALQELGLLTELSSFADSRTNSIIVRGQKDAIERAAKMIRVLDEDTGPPKAPRAADFVIRIVWLVDKSMTVDETPPVPDVPGDLADAIAGLRKKIGIGELRMAAQMIANVASSDDSTFNLSATALQNFNLELSGSLSRRGSENRLNVVFSATHDNQKGQRPVCSLNTTCSDLVAGRPTIVGMTTVHSAPSVLVIELLPKEAK
jgi:type II secretory pathway component GspD/PulD (secretin)